MLSLASENDMNQASRTFSAIKMIAGVSLSVSLGVAVLGSFAFTGVANAAVACQKTQSFDRWLADVKKEAAAQGISASAIATGLNGITPDPAVVRRDHGQGVFQQDFLTFSNRMVAPYRLQTGAAKLKRDAALFRDVEHRFGVPGPVITAFWGLETDFGTNLGKYPTVRSILTLAYDCRRAEFFRPQLFDALRIIQRGDLRPQDMIGDWAGELGPLMMTASDYYKNAVDYDGNGRRDLVHSVPDAIASGANLLKSFGWRAGEPWLQEVKVPATMPWQEADLAIQHPRSQWAAWGVRAAHGAALPADNFPASLLLPMGRLGPAFLAYPNFKAFLGWNSAFVYSTTAAYFATRLAGAPPVSHGNGKPPIMTAQQIADLQRMLTRDGYNVGKIDGKIGTATRGAVKQAQFKVGLPADSWPTPDLLARLHSGR
jgi:lytic murein transglycosylase